MMADNSPAADTGPVDERDELRRHIARVLEGRVSSISGDAVALFPYAEVDPGDELSARLAELIVLLLIASIRDATVDPRSTYISDLRRAAREKGLPVRQLFNIVYLIERAALDELALDESFGATSEPWPSIAQLVRRSAVELLAAFAQRLSQEAGDEALIDPLTTLHTRAMLLAVLEKEIQRAERFGHPFALIVFDIDRLGEINEAHGYGFGDRILERIGIVIRNYFREQDWVTRSSGDTFAVLLPETHREPAEQLAERVRETVQERMSLRDYRSDEQVLVTVSVAVVIAEAVDSGVRAELLLKEAEQAVHRAKHAGRNRVERVEINVKAAAPPTRDSQPL
jgi:diguanylate cyclase (GGDEF)-like protein